MSQSVLVIGAGISGLAAACELTRSGVPVIVLEASSRVGGRIHTDRRSNPPVDLGAQWIHGQEGNPVTHLADELGIKTLPFRHDSLLFTASAATPIYVSEDAADAFSAYQEKAARHATESPEDISYYDAMMAVTPRFGNEEDRISYFAQIARTGLVNAADPHTISARQIGKERFFGGQDRWFPLGYDQIPRKLAEGLDIRYNHRVSRIEESNDRVRVITDKGEFTCDKAIETLPLGVLKTGEIHFSPPLGREKCGAIQRLGMGVLDKTALVFHAVPWPDAGHLMPEPGSGHLHESFTTLKHPDSTSILVGWSEGETARRIEALEDQEILTRALDTLHRMFGNRRISPDRMVVSRWAQNPLSRGSYSFLPVESFDTDYDILAQPQGALFFAGEATSRSYPGTVHGAYLSGIREAMRVMGDR